MEIVWDTRNRYWIVYNLTNSKLDYIHTVIYKYHREGLDKMYENGDAARNLSAMHLRWWWSWKMMHPTPCSRRYFFQTKGDEW